MKMPCGILYSSDGNMGVAGVLGACEMMVVAQALPVPHDESMCRTTEACSFITRTISGLRSEQSIECQDAYLSDVGTRSI